MKFNFLIILFTIITNVYAQEKTQVLPLGSFHFAYPNNDVEQTAKKDQINVMDEKYQKEIETIVNKISEFEPTIVVIEREPYKQQLYDSLYTSYLKGNHTLEISEEQQLGFRIAKRRGLKKVYCVDESARYYQDIDSLLNDKNHSGHQNFMDFFYDNPDRNKRMSKASESSSKNKSLIEIFKSINSDESLKNGLGKGYLAGIFKYETDDGPFLGPDFVSGWWFNRNLRIFRNIQRIGAKPDDRILIIYGVGHMNLFNFFFDCSSEFELVKVGEYLK